RPSMRSPVELRTASSRCSAVNHDGLSRDGVGHDGGRPMTQLTVHTLGTTVSADLSHGWLTDDDRQQIRHSWSRADARLTSGCPDTGHDPVREQSAPSAPHWLPLT